MPLASAGFVGIIYDAVQGYCRPCGRYHTERPLEIVEGHKATLRLMRHVSLLCRWMPASRVCEVLAVPPATAWRYDRHILQTELPEARLDGLEAILIDEKHLGKKGFITTVLNARNGELLYLEAGRDKKCLDGFFSKLSAEQKKGILAVGIDRAGAYKLAVETWLPEAEIVYDKFHIVANYNDVIDKVRRRSWREANLTERSFIKGQRYNLFRNPENLTENGGRQLAALLEANAELNTVYTLKDSLKQVWGYSYRKCAENCLHAWIQAARASSVIELKRFADGLMKAKDQILSYCKHQITSAKIEAFNAVIARVISKACGVSNLDYLFLKLRQESLQR
jgi:transposase